MTATPFIDPDGPEHRERIRRNWEKIGYEYFTTRDLIEIWRHPSGRFAEMTTY